MRIFEESSNRKYRQAVRTGSGRRLVLNFGDINTDPHVALHRGSSESDAGPVTTPSEVSETSSGRSDRWAVVLFDDSHHSMDYVIWALLKTLPELSTADASLIMLEAHNTGKGVVTLCGLTQAEKYRDALRILQLGCDIEPGW
jgi:ATP-dependent Clp protease adaptor protein ClpS